MFKYDKILGNPNCENFTQHSFFPLLHELKDFTKQLV